VGSAHSQTSVGFMAPNNIEYSESQQEDSDLQAVSAAKLLAIWQRKMLGAIATPGRAGARCDACNYAQAHWSEHISSVPLLEPYVLS
jgi:hypothetical protein